MSSNAGSDQSKRGTKGAQKDIVHNYVAYISDKSSKYVHCAHLLVSKLPSSELAWGLLYQYIAKTMISITEEIICQRIANSL